MSGYGAFFPLVTVVAALTFPLRAAEPAPEATITSDELEIRKSGAATVFRGHVVLKQPPYELRANEMTRWRDTQIVVANGRVVGTWLQPSGEKIVATGDHARYNPSKETTELWGSPKVTRWETAVDTNPVVVTAVRFVADQKAGEIRAYRNVNAVQGTSARVQGDEARYVHAEKAIYISGRPRVRVFWQDGRGTADFESDRGWLSFSPRRARLISRVKGRVTPSAL